jgi:hypothetical protein
MDRIAEHAERDRRFVFDDYAPSTRDFSASGATSLWPHAGQKSTGGPFPCAAMPRGLRPGRRIQRRAPGSGSPGFAATAMRSLDVAVLERWGRIRVLRGWSLGEVTARRSNGAMRCTSVP